MILREFKIKEANEKPKTLCYFCLLQNAYDMDGFKRTVSPKELAKTYMAGYVENGEGTINCHHCGPVLYERFGNGWVEVRSNAIPLQ